MARYLFATPVHVEVNDLDGPRFFDAPAGEVELSAADIVFLGQYAPGCATLVVPPAAAAAPVPVVPSEG